MRKPSKFHRDAAERLLNRMLGAGYPMNAAIAAIRWHLGVSASEMTAILTAIENGVE